MRLLCCLLCLTCLAKSPRAQDSLPVWAVKLRCSALLNAYKPAYLVAVEHNLSPRWGLELGLGGYADGTIFDRLEGETYRGPRLWGGARYFLRRRENRRSYFAFMLQYQRISNRSWDEWERQGGQYIEALRTERVADVRGGMFFFGKQFHMGHNKRVLVDYFVGLGARRMEVWRRGVPPDADIFAALPEQEGFFSSPWEWEEGLQDLPDFQVGFFIGYILR